MVRDILHTAVIIKFGQRRLRVFPLHSPEDLAITPVDVSVSALDPAHYESLFVLILATLLDQGSLELDQALWFAHIISVLDFVTIEEHLEEGVIYIGLLPQPGISAMFDGIEPLLYLGHFPLIQRVVLFIRNHLLFLMQVLMLLFGSFQRYLLVLYLVRKILFSRILDLLNGDTSIYGILVSDPLLQ